MSKKEQKSKVEQKETIASEQEQEVKEKKEAMDERVEPDTEPDEIGALNEEIKKEKDNFLRLFAEFENYKKRTSRERIELFSTANRELMTALLPVLDDFERGIFRAQAGL